MPIEGDGAGPGADDATPGTGVADAEVARRARSRREAARYETGVDRGRLARLLAPCTARRWRERRPVITRVLASADGGRVLELGCQAWMAWLEETGRTPRELHCINIAARELARGQAAARTTRLRPLFHRMDAHALAFPDHTFDAVFGAGILHHLDLPQALSEVLRVLKPEGVALFTEPLDGNPVGRLARALTPRARTRDERPLTGADLRMLCARADCTVLPEQCLAVPVGVLAGLLGRPDDTTAVRVAARLDRALARHVPGLTPAFRSVILVLRPQSPA